MSFTISAQPRVKTTRGKLKELRASRRIPANVYGHGEKNYSISLKYLEFDKLLAQAGTSSLIDLVIHGNKTPLKVLISEVQRDPVTGEFTHIDLHQVRMDEKIRTEVALEFVGEAPAVKTLGGNLIINKDTVAIECLPGDLISSIQVDLSLLKQLDQSIHISDLSIPRGITVLHDREGSIASVLPPREEKEEVQPAPDEVAAAAAEGAAAGEAAEEPAEAEK